jgi:hypothetical protein
MVPVLSVAIEDTVIAQAPVVKLLHHKKVVLIDPIRVPRLQAFDGPNTHCPMFFSCHL